MTTEAIFFQDRNVTVTNARFIVGSQTFAMRGITSVEGVLIPASYIVSSCLGLIGVIIAIIGFYSSVILGIVGILLLIVATWLAFQQKPTYAVVLRTAGGEITAYHGKDRDYIFQIIQALNGAIVSHG